MNTTGISWDDALKLEEETNRKKIDECVCGFDCPLHDMKPETLMEVLKESLDAWKHLESMRTLDKLGRASVRQMISRIEQAIDNSGGPHDH